MVTDCYRGAPFVAPLFTLSPCKVKFFRWEKLVIFLGATDSTLRANTCGAKFEFGAKTCAYEANGTEKATNRHGSSSAIPNPANLFIWTTAAPIPVEVSLLFFFAGRSLSVVVLYICSSQHPHSQWLTFILFIVQPNTISWSFVCDWRLWK